HLVAEAVGFQRALARRLGGFQGADLVLAGDHAVIRGAHGLGDLPARGFEVGAGLFFQGERFADAVLHREAGEQRHVERDAGAAALHTAVERGRGGAIAVSEALTHPSGSAGCGGGTLFKDPSGSGCEFGLPTSVSSASRLMRRSFSAWISCASTRSNRACASRVSVMVVVPTSKLRLAA